MKNTFLGLVIGGVMATTAFATTEISHAQREKMAVLHDKMAACLRSDKSLSECRSEMRKNCQNMMGTHGCPMWGEMGGQMGGTMGGNMMQHEGMMGNSSSGNNK